jgi:hypothetical protein
VVTGQINSTHNSSKDKRQNTALDVLLALAVGLGALVLYIATLAPTVLFADGAEFQFVPYTLGIAHPTGYPLYLLLGWVWSHVLPIGDVAYRMNLFSALWAALAVGMTYLVALRFIRFAAPGIDPLTVRLSAVAAALTFAVGETFWSQAVIAEVYSFNAFFVASVLLLTFWLADCLVDRKAQEYPPPVPSGISPLAFRSLVLATVFGLSLTHHVTMLLLLPGILVYLWLVRRSSQPRRRSTHNAFTTGRAAAPETRPIGLFAPRSLLRQVGHVLALMVALAVPLLLYLYLPISLVGLVLALVGLGRLIAGRRWPLLALTGLGYGVGVAFNLAYFIGDIQVLFIPSYLFVSLWLGLGVASVAQGVARGLVRWKGSPLTYSEFGQQGYRRLTEGLSRLIVRTVALLALALPIALLVSNFGAVDQSDNIEAQSVWHSILTKPIPEGSVLVSNDRDEMMPLWYYQYVDGRRPDLLGIFPLIVTEPTYANLGGLIDQALLSQRSVYLIKPMPGLEVKAQLESDPEMLPMIRVSGPALERPPLHPREVELAGVMRLVGYDQSSSSARPGESLTITLYWQPQSEIDFDYSSYVHLVTEAGRGITQSDHQLGGEYYPTSLWRPGEVLRDSHVLTIPQDVAPGVYRLVSGMYRYPSLEPLGGPADIGLMAVEDPTHVQMIFPNDAQSFAETLRISDVEFGERIMLLGYDRELLDSGLELVLYLQAERPLDQNWTVFVHLVDSTGSLVAQHDSQPRDGRYPTSVWDQGEVVDDAHLLVLPANLPDGDYQVVVGLYSVESGERLPVLDGESNPIGDSVPLVVMVLTDGEWQIK